MQNPSSLLKEETQISDTVVVQLGSHNLRIGYSSQVFPFVIPNIIAYRKSQTTAIRSQKYYQPSSGFVKQLGSTIKDLRNYIQISHDLKTQQNYINKQPISFKKAEDLAYMTIEEAKEKGHQVFQAEMQSTPQQNVYIGEEALTIENQSGQFIFHRPIKYGRLNEETQTTAMALSNLQKIIEHSLRTKMELTRDDFEHFNLVLALSENISKSQTIDLVDLFLKDLRFKAILLHRQNILSAFGMQQITCCVVDIGATKLTVSCIQEGETIPGTVQEKFFGGDSINHIIGECFQIGSCKQVPEPWFHFPHKFGVHNAHHSQLIEQFKRDVCGFFLPESEDQIIRTGIFDVKGDEKAKAIPFNYCVLSIITPFVYFLPKLIKHSIVSQLKRQEETHWKGRKVLFVENETDQAPPSDVMSELWKEIQKEREEEEKKKMARGAAAMHLEEDDDSDQENKQGKRESKLKPLKKAKGLFQFEALDQILCRSVCSIKDRELRNKLANSILLVGGGSKFDGFSEIFQDRLIECIQQYDETIERIEVITPHTLLNQMKKIPLNQDPQGLLKKELAGRFNFDPQTVGWGGASLISKIDYSKELYVSREKWLCERGAAKQISESDGGIGALKERAAFLI